MRHLPPKSQRAQDMEGEALGDAHFGEYPQDWQCKDCVDAPGESRKPCCLASYKHGSLPARANHGRHRRRRQGVSCKMEEDVLLQGPMEAWALGSGWWQPLHPSKLSLEKDNVSNLPNSKPSLHFPQTLFFLNAARTDGRNQTRCRFHRPGQIDSR